METLIFVLGTLSGLFLIGMVYAFVGVLKMSKQIKELQEEVHSIHRRIDETGDSLWRDMDTRFKEHEKHSDYIADQINRKEEVVHQRIADLNSYVDSRIDKTVDALCLRIDVTMDEHKKEFEHVHLHLK
jgi:septal ring factor EnvC (AmiA/AmiB activator)